jgi:hypothetical protein
MGVAMCLRQMQRKRDGPFKTKREAEQDALRWALEIAASAESTRH